MGVLGQFRTEEMLTYQATKINDFREQDSGNNISKELLTILERFHVMTRSLQEACKG